MKHLLTILLLLPLFGFAQDSTSFSTQEVKEFVPLNIMDEYEKAYGREQKTALKLGVTTTPFNSVNTNAFVELNRKISYSSAISIGVKFNEHFYKMNNSMPLVLISFFMPYFEYKKYIKNLDKLNNFNGKYFSIYYSTIPVFKHLESIQFLGVGKYNAVNNLELRLGNQFGSTIDYCIILGASTGFLAEKQENGILKNLPNYTFNPYFSSNLRIGVDLLEKSTDTKKCEFIDCNRIQNKALKLNLMDLFYVDKYLQILRFSPDFEQRIASSSFTVNINPSVAYFNKSYYPVSRYIFASDSARVAIVEGESRNSNTLKAELNAHLRWYFLLKRNIRKGLQNKNLSGIYLMSGIRNQFLSNNNFYNVFEKNQVKNQFDLGIFSVGFGMQTIIKGKYFFDFNESFSFKKNLYSPIFDTQENSELKIGLKLGIVK